MTELRYSVVLNLKYLSLSLNVSKQLSFKTLSLCI